MPSPTPSEDAFFSELADQADPPESPYRRNPALWASEKLGEFFWSKQVEIAQSVVDHRRTAVKSCHDVGKSFSAARIAAWWLDTHPAGEAFVVTTAPTFPQVRAILWREIGRAHRKGKLPGRVNQTEWWLGEELVAFGRKPSDYDEAAFQGIHARYVLVILDEACGIPDQLWVAAGALVTNEGSAVLAIGNPDDPTSHFAKVCQPGSGWHVIRIQANESPNFTDEDVPAELRPLLVSQAYLDDLIADGCGPGTPIWTSKVDGDFPEDSEDSVVRASSVAKCRIAKEVDPDAPVLVELGVDVGGSEKGDQTVVRERRGNRAGRRWGIRSSESELVADEVLKAIVESGATRVKIDSIGIGWGVAGHLNRMSEEGKHNATIVKVNVGSASNRPERFPKLRDEIWWEVGRMHSENGTWDLSEIDDRTAVELSAPKWGPNDRGQIKVEPKKDTRERLGRSPDDADALLLAFYTGAGDFASYIAAAMAEQDAEPEVKIPGTDDVKPKDPLSEYFGQLDATPA